MKRQIFIYLFLFALLIALFVFIEAEKRVSKSVTKQESLSAQLEELKTELESCKERTLELSYFNLESHYDALSYFEAQGLDPQLILPKIKDELHDTNTGSAEHPLIPFSASEGRKLLINKTRFLNHKWLIVDFSDGELFGEALIDYYVDSKQNIDFELIKATLYPKL